MPDSDRVLPTDVDMLQHLLLAREAELAQVRSDFVQSQARESNAAAVIAHLQLAVEKMRRDLYGQRSERGARILDQMEFELADLVATASEDDLAAEGTTARSFTRRTSSRKPFPEHFPRERILVPGPVSSTRCGSPRRAQLGEDVTETLEVIPRQGKVLQYVREKVACRACETISQAPAPFHGLPRGFAGPNLLAMVLFE